jgi:hypothetical protein
MTLPTSIDLPLRVDYQSDEDIDRYLKDLVYELQEMYERITENVNGSIRNYADTDQTQWVPTLNGTVSGTFTYTQQVGWSIRQGIYTEIFADISWSSTTAAGNLYIELPYNVTLSNGMPFVGTVQPSSIAFAGSNLVINAIPNTYRGEIWSIGSGLATANLAVPASGRLIIHSKYIGVSDE